MKATLLIVTLALASGCSKKSTERALESAAGSAASTPSETSDGPASSSAVAGLLFDPVDDHSDPVMRAVFGEKLPRLPAINADGTLIATLDMPGQGPETLPPLDLRIAKFPSNELVTTMSLVTEDEASANEDTEKLPLALASALRERGVAAIGRLQGFHSLVQTPLDIESGGEPRATKLGDVTLTPTQTDGSLTLVLSDSKLRSLQREHIVPYVDGERGAAFENAPCEYLPTLNAAYRDPARPELLLIEVGFRFGEDCEAGHPRYLVWSTEPAGAAPVAQIHDVVTGQLALAGLTTIARDDIAIQDAALVSANLLGSFDDIQQVRVVDRVADYGGHDARHVAVVLSRDGKSAWASAIASVSAHERNKIGKDRTWRVSDLLVQAPNGWRIAAAAWTEPKPNAAVNRDAKAGKLQASTLDASVGGANDGGLRDAFAKLATEGAVHVASDLVAIGSGPGERTVGRPAFVRAWNAAWKGKVTIVSSVAKLAPSGTTGWVASTIELAKSGYTIPFTVFCVFDKASDGAWTLVHVHFAV